MLGFDYDYDGRPIQPRSSLNGGRSQVRVNAEGITVFDERGEDTGQGLPFIDRTVTRLLRSEPMASPGAACLALAWRHRIALLTS